jgi:cephalosporin hydroxylase
MNSPEPQPSVLRKALKGVVQWGINAHAGWIDTRKPSRSGSSGLKELDEILERASVRSDISDHLPTLFVESVPLRPKLIVELGVRGGESTFVFERVGRLYDSHLVSVDLLDCSKVIAFDKWHFVQADDIEYAKRFPEWCRARGIEPQIDVLFIDTSHLYEHTLEEMRSWFPLTAARSKVFFHDTNQKRVYRRRDGSFGLAWDNQRGVIRALEAYFQRRFDESNDFVAVADGWLIEHQAACSGLTMATKLGS